MANNSRVNITLGFNADTDQAKRQINDLVNQLRSIQSTPTTLVDDTSLRKASAAAAELQGHLQKAVDVNTGKLDLSRFSASLKQSGKQLSDYRRDLEAIGPTGSQAFLSVAKSIATAETPLLRANKHLNDFLTTMKNTAKWQISSSIMHGFMGAVQQAYGYSQSLNESLNNIRIVTGYNTEQMAEFASQANKAAKALSTTTTDYTNASLIYFQQGLSDEEVQKRTDITVKMANVARDSVDNVSNQLTAIWNNFYEEGGKSLEYYADVMTALGAKTASSTEEIAGGLEKFAAIGDTIGLSYEYAASALATITSNTRQSEEVVGTALKTIFARIQGLNLGETLEDGTSLNKYSEALAKVGVSIFEQNGELKAMNNILDELAARWSTLNSAQQAALAQTVAGVRQYTQLIALMENWDNGDEDSFMANINTSRNAEGALNEQANIYAESWEAARERVKAASEDIYTSLINDEFFIQLDKYLVPVLETVDGLIDGFGGLGGIIATVGSIFISHFAKEIPGKIKNLTANISVLSGKATKAAVEMQKAVSADLSKAAGNKNQNLSYQNELAITSQKAQLYAELNERASQMSEEERKQYELALQQIDITGKQILEESERLDLLKQQNKERERQINSSISTTARAQTVDSDQLWREQIKATSDTKKSANKKIQNIQRDLKSDDPEKRANAQKRINQLTDEGRKNTEVYNKILKQNQKHLINQKKALLDSAKAVEKMELSFEKAGNTNSIVDAFQIDDIDANKIDIKQFENVKNSIRDVVNEFQQLGLVGTKEYKELIAIIDSTSSTPTEVKNAWKEFFNAFADSTASSAAAGDIYAKLEINADKLAQSLDVSADELRQWAQQAAAGKITAEELRKRMESLANTSKNLGISTVQISELLGHATGTLVAYAGMLSSINSGMDQLYDTNATGLEKFSTVVSMLTSFGSSLGVATTGFSKLSMMMKPAGEGVAAFSKTTAGATGKFGHFITSLTSGQAAASGMSASAATLAGVLGIVAIAATAAIAAFAIGATIIQKNLDAAADRASEAAEKTQEYAESLREADKSNSDYVKQLKQSLNIWEETKEDLTAVNETVDALTEAYDLQSGALAKLTGKQEDYNRVLKEAKGAEQREKKKRIEAEKDNIEKQIESAMAEGRAIQDGMTGRLSSYDTETGKLNLIFDGGSLTGNGEEESKAAEILEKAFKEAGLDSETQYGNAVSGWLESNGLGAIGTLVDGNRSRTTVSFDANDAEAYIKAYDATKAAMSEMVKELGDQAYTQDYYKDAKAWTDAVGSAIEKIKESKDELDALELQVSGAADQLFNVNSYQEYEKWLSETTTALDDGKKSVDEIDEAIKLLEDTSLNPVIQQFARFKDALNEAGTITGLDPKTIENALRDALPNDATIEEILTFTGTINFNAIFDEGQLDTVVRNAQTYANYTTSVQQKGLLEDTINKLNSGDIESSDYTNIADIIKFANEKRVKQIDFEEFLKADEDDQREILAELYDWVSLRTTNYGNRLSGIGADSADTSIETAREEQSKILNEYGVNNLEELQAKVEEYQKAVENAATKYGVNSGEYAKAFVDQKTLNEDIDKVKKLETAIEGFEDQKIEVAADTAAAEKAIKELNEIEVEIKVDAKVEAEQLALDVVDAQIAAAKAIVSNPESTAEQKKEAESQLVGLEAERDIILGNIINAAAAESKEIISNMQIWAKDSRTAEFMQNLKSVTKDGERIFTDEEITEFQNALAGGDIKTLIDQLTKILPKLQSNESNFLTYWETTFDPTTAEGYEKDYDTFTNNIKAFIDGWIKSTNIATEATEKLSESAKKAAEELEQVKWYDKYDAEKPIDNREARLEGDLEQAKALGKQVSQSLVESTAAGLKEALKDRQGLVNEQLTDTKFDIQKENFGAKFGVNGDLLNGKELAKSLTEELNKEEAKGDQADEARINRLEKRIELLNTYNSLMGESIDLYYELNTYTGDTYHLKSLADEIDLYAELEKELTYIDDALEDIRREKDKAYGQNYINSLHEENKAIEQQNKLLKQKIQIAKEQIPVQQNDIQIALDLLNKTAQAEFDEATGRLLNGNEIRMQLAREMASQQEGIMAALNAGNIVLANQLNQAYEDSKKLYDQIIATLDALLDTEQLIIDTENAFEDNLAQIQSNISEGWNYSLELDIKINDNELSILDTMLARLDDNLKGIVESFAIMSQKMVQTTAIDFEKQFSDLQAIKDQISPEQYASNLQTLFDEIGGNINSLIDMDKEMKEYYSKALDAAGETFDYYSGQLEHFTSILEHYQNIVTLVEGEVAYDKIGTVLEGKVSTLQNEMDAASSYYEMLKAQQEEVRRQYEMAPNGSKAKEVLEENLKAITEATNEAQEEMLSKTEEWAEATKELMENTMAKAARAMEMAFTDGLTFDALSSSMDRLSSYQDEYLTKTNQMYETEKLMRTAQQAADKTQNKIAKDKLQEYIKETSQLQNKNKLSHLELEIQQAKYDLLVAEIALEEAQNAKSTVRLRRDSEGNFGYVYTADSDKIASAEQDLADAQNNLYNIGLEAANDYGQKRIELQQQLADDLMALEERRVNGEFETEQAYYDARDNLIKEYTDLFTAYANQYAIAMGTDANIQQEAWVTSYQNIIDKTNVWSNESTNAFDQVGTGIENWKTIVEQYMGDCETAYSDWKTTVDTKSKEVNELLTNTKGKVDEVTKASTGLKDEVDTVVKDIGTDLTLMQSYVVGWATGVGGQVDTIIGKYQALQTEIQKAMLLAQQQSATGGLTGENHNPNNTDTKPNEGIITDTGLPDPEAEKKAAAAQLASRAEGLIRAVHYGAIGYGDKTGWHNDAIANGYSAEEIALAQKAFNDSKPGAGYDYFFNEALKLVSAFDTGGYTGTWGPEGRLAMVHEKEIILNEQDTKNFLAATGILKDIISVIDLQSMYNQMQSPAAIGVSGGGGFFEQSVHIEANFPGVTDRNEIQEAFNNLLNTAQQYVNRK